MTIAPVVQASGVSKLARNMSEMQKSYEPGAVESRWYPTWLKQNAFAAKAEPGKEAHAIMIPPPNVTGVLHMGHILNNTLQDIFTRRARLEGKSALWFPGTDHAGIATQTRVERKLREQDLHRRDLGREKFLGEVWKWRDEHGGIILNQLQKLGASCDWDRTAFTLDESYSRAVLNSFVLLWKRGYIYRGQRMSNWCPVSQTALSNEEVIMKPQRGLLYKMRYEIVERPGEDVEISTTRPETIMGDTAVAVHPEDDRFKDLIGCHVWRPFPREQIPIIADSIVDREFGTGCLKVTPAHDVTDFEIGKRHNLPILDVFNPDGTLNALAGPDFEGMDRADARKKAADKLKELGNLVDTEPYENNVGFSERADVPVEPRLTEQFWLRYPKVDEARKAVTEGVLKFHPKRWEKTYLHWLDTMERDNIDWCISRQLWWGHRIPVWYRKGIERSELDFQNPEHVHVSVDGPDDPENWEQEEDVLDTWASSWLWPFANFGWPDADGKARQELEFFYPTSVLVTGFDIIFLWVARMVMAGLEFMGEEKKSLTTDDIRQRIPFRDVYMTGLIRDEKGRKMSKSLGNSPDPLELIDRYGADGLRFGIVNIAPSGQDILFSEERIEIGRNFCNKLWNACRFRQMNAPTDANTSIDTILGRIRVDQLDSTDHWILSRLLTVTEQIQTAFDKYEMHAYPHLLYAFFWTDYCDWYVEASKSKLKDPDLQGTVLAIQDLVLRQLLLQLEPLTPFITEELWHALGYAAADSDLIQNTRLPSSDDLRKALSSAGIEVDSKAVEQVEGLKEMIVRIRALKAEYNVANRKDVAIFWTSDSGDSKRVLEQNIKLIKALASVDHLEFVADAPDGMPAGVAGLGTVYIDLASSVDVEAEVERLGREHERLLKGIRSGEAKLSNEKFVANAPESVVAGARKQLEETKARFEEIERLIQSLKK